MKLKGKPQAPRRKDIDHVIELPCDVVVFDILPHCIKHLTECDDYTFHELQLLSEHDIKLDYRRGYYDEVELNAVFTTLESDASFNRRQQAYENRMDDYNQWLTDNADEIAVEIAERERRAKEDERERTQARVDKLAKQLAMNHAKLQALKE